MLGAAASGFPIDLLATIDAAEAAALPLAALVAPQLLDISSPRTRTGVADIALPRPAGARASRPGPGVGNIAGPRRLIGPSPELLALLCSRPRLPIALACGRVTVGDAPPVPCIVLPAVAVADIGAVEVAVDVHGAVRIDIHIAAAATITPVPATEDGACGREAQAPHEAGRERAPNG